MIRILGVNIPKNKNVLISLTYIYGIGISISKSICNKLKINYNIKIKDLNLEEISDIKKEISLFCVEGELKKNIFLNIRRLIDIKSYRGIRHTKKLPSRGQRTRTNAKTSKKNKIKFY